MFSGHLIEEQPWELQAAGAAGITTSQLRFTLSFFLSVLAGLLLRCVPTTTGRHLFSALSGFLLVWYPFGNGVLHALVTTGLTYLLMLRFRQHAGTLAWLVVFPYLIMCHMLSASGMAWKEGKLDFTGAQMVITLKLIAAAVCYQDGAAAAAAAAAKKGEDRSLGERVAAASTAAGGSSSGGSNGGGTPRQQAQQQVQQQAQGQGVAEGGAQGQGEAVQHHKDQHPHHHHHHRRHSPGQRGASAYIRAKQLQELPSPLEFLSYVFASGNLLAGPFFECRDYLDFIARKGDWDGSDPSKRPPLGLLPGLARLFKGLVFMGLWARLYPLYGPHLMESSLWATFPLWKRMSLLWLAGLMDRFKYYFAWAVSESSLIFSGFCFDGWRVDSKGRRKAKWTRCINCRIRRVEFCTSAATIVSNWNACTGNWLRHYVYERLTPPGKRPTFRSVVLTQTVSGVWHGLFPGYWLFFVSSAFMLEASKVLYRYEQGWPPRLRHFPLWTLVKMLFTAYTLNYCAAAFMILDFGKSMAVWQSVYFSGHALMLGIILVGAALPPRRPRIKPQRADEAAAAAGASMGEATAAAGAAGQAAAGEDGQVKGADEKKVD